LFIVTSPREAANIRFENTKKIIKNYLAQNPYTESSVTNFILNYCHFTNMTATPAFQVKWKSQITDIFKGDLDNPPKAAQTFSIIALVTYTKATSYDSPFKLPALLYF
jgi:hypothetical protein